MPIKAAIGRVGLVTVLAIIIVIAAVGVYASQMTTSQKTSSSAVTTTSYYATTYTTPFINGFIYIENGSLSLCASNCLYPSPHLSATVFVNSTVPLKSLDLYINNSLEDARNYSNNLTNYAIGYTDTPNNQTLPILPGKSYVILLAAAFEDNRQSNASAFVIASPSSLTQSGPISTYPAAWGLFSSCPGFPKQGTITTLGIGNVTYPNAWNTTTIVTLNQVYNSIIKSSAFASVSSGHGWVVYSWSFVQGGSNNSFPNGNTIVGYFILTNSAAPDGYVTAFYNIENGSVALNSVTTTVTVNCPSFSTSSQTISQTMSPSCPNNYPHGIDPADAPTINTAENSTAVLCVRFYYYNPNSTMQIIAGNVFGIAGYRQFNSTFSNGFDGSSNFTIITSSENITIGGPQNLNEGILVEYSIHPNPNSDGTYNYGFQATIYPSLELCNGFGTLVVGDGSPNYNIGFGSCAAPLTNPPNSEGFVDGILFVEVVGATNSSS